MTGHNTGAMAHDGCRTVQTMKTQSCRQNETIALPSRVSQASASFFGPGCSFEDGGGADDRSTYLQPHKLLLTCGLDPQHLAPLLIRCITLHSIPSLSFTSLYCYKLLGSGNMCYSCQLICEGCNHYGNLILHGDLSLQRCTGTKTLPIEASSIRLLHLHLVIDNGITPKVTSPDNKLEQRLRVHWLTQTPLAKTNYSGRWPFA